MELRHSFKKRSELNVTTTMLTSGCILLGEMQAAANPWVLPSFNLVCAFFCLALADNSRATSHAASPATQSFHAHTTSWTFATETASNRPAQSSSLNASSTPLHTTVWMNVRTAP